MPHTFLKRLLLSKPFYLPNWEVDDTRSFLHHYDSKMALFMLELKKLPEDSFGGTSKKIFLKNMQVVSDGIKNSLIIYLNGYPAKAFSIFKSMIDNADITNLLNMRTSIIDKSHSFYRIKREYDKEKFKRKRGGFIGAHESVDLFHVAFQNRKNIGTTRFSIPGFPCLYLSDSLHTSWSECLTNDDDNEKTQFHTVSFKNHRPLYIVDLAPLNFIVTKNRGNIPAVLYNNDEDLNLLYYAYMYPLIFACHTKIKYIPKFPGEVQFRSEYIVPQLLLQWYREQEDLIVDGIRYLSCTAEQKFPRKKTGKYNYVIPVTTCDEAGHCKDLLINFSSSPVYSHLRNSLGVPLSDILADIQESLKQQTYSAL